MSQVKDYQGKEWTLIQIDTEIDGLLEDYSSEINLSAEDYPILLVKESDGLIEEIRGALNANLDSETDLIYKLCPKCGIGDMRLSHESYSYTGRDGEEREDIEAVLLCSDGCGNIER